MRAMVQRAHVVVPEDVQRDSFVKYCLRSQTVSILDSNGQFINNCPIVSGFNGVTGGLMGAMDFPPDSERLGSEVVIIFPYEFTIPFVIGVVKSRQSSAFLEKEHTVKLEENLETGSYHISGDAVKGIMNFFVESQERDGGKLNFASKNGEATAEINFSTNFLYLLGSEEVKIRSNSKFLVEVIKKSDANTKAQIMYELAKGLDIVDEFGNYIQTRDGKIEMDADEIKLGKNATSPIAKGDLVQSVLSQVLDLLAQEKVVTVFGASPLILSPIQTQVIKQTVEKVLSSKGKVE